MNKYRKLFLIVAWALVVPAFVWQQVAFLGGNAKAEEATALTAAEQEAADAADKVAAAEAAKQDAIDEKNDELSDAQKKLNKEIRAKALLEQKKAQIGTAISSTQKSINTTKSVISETESTISRKEAEVKNLNDKIELQKSVLRGLLQQIYYNQGQPILNVVLTSGSFADVFSDTDHLLTIGDRLKNVSTEISQTKLQVEQDKAELALEKQKHEEILDVKVDQKQELVADQIDVQGDIQDKNAIIAKLQRQLVELQGDLSTLSGKSYNAKDIRGAVEIASNSTGVPEGVLYGFLKMETNLGANTGKCTYEEVESVSVSRYKVLLKKNKKWQASIDLLYKRQGIFYDLVKDLGYNKDKKVSCSPPPSAYIGQGGAMGIPQFMSDVWMGYSPKIAAATGHKNPDPWNLTDGVMAMALKLKGAGATSSKESVIKSASINYLGTLNANYYNGIVYWSKNYKLLFQ